MLLDKANAGGHLIGNPLFSLHLRDLSDLQARQIQTQMIHGVTVKIYSNPRTCLTSISSRSSILRTTHRSSDGPPTRWYHG